ncbi:hypothetical protein [Marinicella litoralis]|uniref:hypothetical protein n=1 Tax=Marinicella litoralis TaxID=644220 RepID=UPI000BFEC3B8|nr:hypothetical protein [Marinicella litoralis]
MIKPVNPSFIGFVYACKRLTPIHKYRRFWRAAVRERSESAAATINYIAAITVFAKQKKWWRRFWRAAVGERSESAAATINFYRSHYGFCAAKEVVA